jgi:hypothetical protein
MELKLAVLDIDPQTHKMKAAVSLMLWMPNSLPLEALSIADASARW